MTLDVAARVSGYLTLALAAACLTCADAAFVPALPLLLLPVFALLGAAFVADGRGWVLPIWAANVAGVLIVLGVAAGVAVYFLRPAPVPGQDLPLALLLLPYVGPLLMVLVLVKLFRSKTASDLWAMQGLGLLMAALGCALAEGGPFGGLLLAYFACGGWHLALAYLRREGLRAGGSAAGAVPWQALGVLHGARWLVAAVLLAGPVFFLAPRVGDHPWSPRFLAGPQASHSADRAEVGLANGIDLNGTETLDPTDDVALRVQAFRDATSREPKTDLRPGQRWRGPTLDSYQNGRWAATRPLMANSLLSMDPMVAPRMMMRPTLPGAPQELPDLGPGQFYLDFTVMPKVAGGLVLAEPVALRERRLPLISAPGAPRARLLFEESLGVIVPVVQPPDRTEVRYRQVVPADADADLSEPVTVPPRYAALLAQQPVAALGPWAQDLTRRLAGRPGSALDPADLEPVPTIGGQIGPRDPERVARTLAAYLASSGDYAYSFEQERSDPDLDPTLDFLANVRHGPCTRFASGLALMLRALGVPARVVLGFRGCDNLGGGSYQVLASQAHAWVEVLVERPGATAQWRWLALDPTPSSDAVPRPAFSLARWWEKHRGQGATLWHDYVLEYNPGRQESEVLRPLGDALGRAWDARPGTALAGLVAVLAVAGLGAVYLPRGRRKPRASGRRPTRVAFYGRLLRVLATAHGLRPLPGQTPREFAAEAGRVLRGRGTTADVADVPARVAELFYRAAFGGRPLTDDEAREVGGRLDALAAAR
jgi:transglutaminase-like putative cysteine protease